VIVRRFRVREGGEKDFELIFAPDGVWAELLRSRSPGYTGTELKRLAPEDRSYEIRDCFRSHRSFEVFRDWYQADVARFREWLAGNALVEQEIFLGGFYWSGPDEGDEAGLVST
jgi:hypothetical protein